MREQDRVPDHMHVFASLAAESRLPIDEVATLYERERAELAVAARVSSYLDIFAIRNVREMLRKRGSGEQAPK